MNLQIRQCEITDAKAIHDLNLRELGYDYSDDATKEKIVKLLYSSKDRIYVALIDGNVIGYVHANDYDVIYEPHMKNIMGIAVSSNFRKMGIGKALLDSVEHWARDTGASGVRLVSGATRTGAHEFYHHADIVGIRNRSIKKNVLFSLIKKILSIVNYICGKLERGFRL